VLGVSIVAMWHTQTLTGPSVSLLPLQPSHLEQVRQWRNSDNVRRQMVNQQIISASAQRAWFYRIKDDRSQLHYVIHYKDLAVGVANIKQPEGKALCPGLVAETGFFIGDEEHRGSMLAFFAAIVINDYCFHQLQLATLLAQVKSDNTPALRFNQQLGYVPLDNDSRHWQYLTLNVSQHDDAKQKFSRFFEKPNDKH